MFVFGASILVMHLPYAKEEGENDENCMDDRTSGTFGLKAEVVLGL
jgi:hypothetical protein